LPETIRLVKCLAGVLWLAVTVLSFAAPPAPSDPAQADFDRFMDLIADSMYGTGRTSTISVKQDASDQDLVASAVDQLNKRPAPVKTWHLLKSAHVGASDFEAHISHTNPSWGFRANQRRYLIAVIDSDQGRKIMAIGEGTSSQTQRWARMYNCDATFTSPQDGGTPLIRTDIPTNR
jgi:hypothetical protein